jgi:hypothetical protein
METQARFSPDGNWIAYVLVDDGQADVFIQRNPIEENSSSDKQKVSKQGGCEPVWARNGEELFYRSLDGSRIFSVDVQLEPSLNIGREKIIIDDIKMPAFSLLASGHDYYDVVGDEEKFLLIVEAERSEIMRINVVLNWFEELREIMSAGK